MVLKFYRMNVFGSCRSCETSSHAAAPAQMGMPADIQYVHSRERLDASYLVGKSAERHDHFGFTYDALNANPN